MISSELELRATDDELDETPEVVVSSVLELVGVDVEVDDD